MTPSFPGVEIQHRWMRIRRKRIAAFKAKVKRIMGRSGSGNLIKVIRGFESGGAWVRTRLPDSEPSRLGSWCRMIGITGRTRSKVCLMVESLTESLGKQVDSSSSYLWPFRLRPSRNSAHATLLLFSTAVADRSGDSSDCADFDDACCFGNRTMDD